MSREQLYNEQMAPLVAALIQLAKTHSIPMFASFELNDERPTTEQDGSNPARFCTNAILPTGSHKALHACYLLVRQVPRVLLHDHIEPQQRKPKAQAANGRRGA